MSDIVVTIPKGRWEAWLAEGCLPGERCPKRVRYFVRTAGRPRIKPGERVYIVAHGRLRGFAPLTDLTDHLYGWSSLRDEEDIVDKWKDEHREGFHWYLVRRGGAVAVTIRDEIPGFQGFRYRWWHRDEEHPFIDWRRP